MRAGEVYGAADEIGKYTGEPPVEVHDLHATIPHELGIDQERLNFRQAGRHFRPPDVHGCIFREIIS